MPTDRRHTDFGVTDGDNDVPFAVADGMEGKYQLDDR